MNAELLRSAPLLATVHSVEVFRLKQGDDHVYLHTNLPSPRSPYQGGLSLHLTCDRGTGTDWVHANFPGVETHMYDHTIGRIRAHNPASSRLPQATLENLERVFSALG